MNFRVLLPIAVLLSIVSIQTSAQQSRPLTSSLYRQRFTKTLHRLQHHQQPTPTTSTHNLGVTTSAGPSVGRVRDYFLTVEELDWNYAPTKWDHLYGKSLNDSMAALYTVHSLNPPRVGAVYRKAAYRAYTDASFRMRISHDSYLGTLGPVIRAEVGDRVRVRFRNMASRNYSVYPYGVVSRYDRSKKAGAPITPGEEHVYEWDIPDRSGPGPKDPSSLVWAYVSDANPTRDLHSGLVGPLIVYKRGLLEPGILYPTKQDFDQEIVTIMMVNDENRSHYLTQSLALAGLPTSAGIDLTDATFRESNRMYNVNGFVFNNMEPLMLVQGSRVRWYLMTLGDEIDIHTAHWHGATTLIGGHRLDTVELLPGTFRTADLVPDNPGQWLFHCHVSKHMMAGMSVFYQILSTNGEEW
ncbi:Cupredoxin [Jimgerdemannia flammicorona]|uniref:Cupredoxin n=1 Tax=Jimgerdemannia flammicorona TaxID=994334 RepID=A0A433QR62_9FUNG|nr:Cupredoxin [Jimgerdemannia flammicorona]